MCPDPFDQMVIERVIGVFLAVGASHGVLFGVIEEKPAQKIQCRTFLLERGLNMPGIIDPVKIIKFIGDQSLEKDIVYIHFVDGIRHLLYIAAEISCVVVREDLA